MNEEADAAQKAKESFSQCFLVNVACVSLKAQGAGAISQWARMYVPIKCKFGDINSEDHD